LIATDELVLVGECDERVFATRTRRRRRTWLAGDGWYNTSRFGGDDDDSTIENGRDICEVAQEQRLS